MYITTQHTHAFLPATAIALQPLTNACYALLTARVSNVNDMREVSLHNTGDVRLRCRGGVTMVAARATPITPVTARSGGACGQRLSDSSGL